MKRLESAIPLFLLCMNQPLPQFSLSFFLTKNGLNQHCFISPENKTWQKVNETHRAWNITNSKQNDIRRKHIFDLLCLLWHVPPGALSLL